MKKFHLLLLDANIVIELFRQGIWDRVVEVCDVHLSRTVAENEAHFYEDDTGERQDFDLAPDAKAGRITVFDVRLSELAAFRSRFDPSYFERLDAGEAESLAFLLDSGDPCLICSADSIVYKVIGNLDRAGQGISLEEVLQRTGLGRGLAWQFTKGFRETWTRKGFQEGLGGIGHIE
ncbi:MAG: hypothetical protein R6X20_02575 [Phycisphaerae bacterium]